MSLSWRFLSWNRSRRTLAPMTWRKRDLSKIIDHIPLGVAITLPDGTLEYANPYFCKLIGARSGELVGTPLACWLPANASANRGVGESASAGPAWRGETCIRVSGGGSLDVLEAVYPLRDETDAVAHLIHLVQDISAQKQLEHLSAFAFYDGLTGLPNRNLLNDRLARAIAGARRRCGVFALLYIDVDHFKEINDTQGHDAGDALLRQLAARLSESLRAADTVARWGGDEFVVMLDGVASPQAVTRIIRKLFSVCGEPYDLGGSARTVTLSIGASLFPRDGHDIPTLLKRADQAMYAVKKRGRNGYHVLKEPRSNYQKTTGKDLLTTVDGAQQPT